MKEEFKAWNDASDLDWLKYEREHSKTEPQ